MWENDSLRGTVPVGTTMAAGLQEINPFLLEWYYKHKSENDELVAGPSGYQFIYGRDYQKEGYESWLEKNRRWLASAVFIQLVFGMPHSEVIVSIVLSRLPDCKGYSMVTIKPASHIRMG